LRDDARAKANALIRANFHIDPELLQVSQRNELYAQAYFIEQFRLENQARLLTALFKAVFGKRVNR
jgi:hypothetical protein